MPVAPHQPMFVQGYCGKSTRRVLESLETCFKRSYKLVSMRSVQIPLSYQASSHRGTCGEYVYARTVPIRLQADWQVYMDRCVSRAHSRLLLDPRLCQRVHWKLAAPAIPVQRFTSGNDVLPEPISGQLALSRVIPPFRHNRLRSRVRVQSRR